MANGEEAPTVDGVPLRQAAPGGPLGESLEEPQGEPHGEPGRPAEAADGGEPAVNTADTAETAQPIDTARTIEIRPGDTAAGLSPARHRRALFGRGLHAIRRWPPPHRMLAAAGRAAAAWSRRPAGKLTTTGLLILALVAIAGAAGTYLVPSTVSVDAEQADGSGSASARSDATQTSSNGADAPGPVPSGGAALTTSPSPSAGSQVAVNAARPADALRDWASEMGSRVDVPVVALQAYAYAELVLAQTTPACHLSWTTLAAIGKVESGHGSSNKAVLYPDGRALPRIVGPPLDGKDGRAAVPDTDQGGLDGDATWDRAVGPMQFIPSTWRSQAVDADNDSVRDPSDIDDAALAAANYLCSGGRDLKTPTGWWQAIAAYNAPQSYGEKIFAAANTYGQQSQG